MSDTEPEVEWPPEAEDPQEEPSHDPVESTDPES